MPPSKQANLFEADQPGWSGTLFEDLTRDAIDVLVFVAAQWDTVSMTAVASSLPKAGLSNEADKRFVASAVKADLRALDNRGLLEMGNQGRLVPRELRPKILGLAFGNPDYRPRATALAEWALKTSFNSWYYDRSGMREQVRLELLVYLGRFDDVIGLVAGAQSGDSEGDISLAFLMSDFDPDCFSELPEDLRRAAIFEYLANTSFVLGPVETAWSALAEIEPSPSLIALIGTLQFLRGDEAEVHEMIEQLRSAAEKSEKANPEAARKIPADARSLEACLQFARGDIDGSIAGFEESIKIEQGPTRRKKFCPRWIGGIVFQLALCRRGEARDLQRARQIAKWGVELNETLFSGLGGFGDNIAECISGEPRQAFVDANYRNESFLQGDPPNLNSLLFAILYRLAGANDEDLSAWEKRIGELADLASERGYRWLAMEAAAFSASIKNSAANRKRLQSLTDAAGIEGATPFADQFQAPESWEGPLKAMEAVAEKFGRKASAGTAAKKKSAARKELIWHLRIVMGETVAKAYSFSSPFGDDDWDDDFEEDDDDDEIPSFVFGGRMDQPFYFDLVPIERSVSKTGRVTKGRAIALKRLKEQSDAIVSLTDQDRAVAKYVKKQRNWGRREIFFLEDPRALVALAGHPLLFADAEATRPLTLTRERIRVDVSEDKKGGVTVQLIPPLSASDQHAKLVEQGPDRYTIYEIPKAVAELAKAFDENPKLKLPATAKARLMNAISTLAEDLEIGAEGDLAGEGADAAEFRQIEGDVTPRLRLIPDGDGLRANLLVRPIATSDFTFSPGAGKTAIFGFAKDERIQALRDLEAETARAEAVVKGTAALDRHRGESPDPWVWSFDSPLACLELLRDVHHLIEQAGNSEAPVVLEWPEGEPIKLAGVVSAGHATVALGGSSDWLTLSGEVAVNDDLVFSMRKLLEFSAASTRPGFVEIGKGQFVALTEEFQRQIDDLRALSQPGKGETIKLPPLAALALEDFVDEAKPAGGKKSRAALWREWIDRFREARDHSPEPPSTLRAELRPYQLDGYRWLSRLAKTGAGACLADDMGLGKTVQALALLLERADQGPSLVMAPTSVAANWIDETVRFAPTLNPVVFGAGDRTAQLAELGPRDLVICTYGLLQREAEALGAVEWNVIVLDEAQAIKNSATQRSKAARKLRGAFRVVTTGTPVENRLSELHTLFQFVLPGFLGSSERFRKQFADPIERNRDPEARSHLRRLIQPFLLRRLKSSVLEDLPERTEINLHVDLGDEEAAFYEALRGRAVEKLEEGGDTGAGAIQILAELTRLRRACCHPVLVDKKAGATLSSAKLAAFSETLDELLAGEHKVLVFSQFVDHLSLIREALEKAKVSYQYLDGSTSRPKRKQAVDDFQRGEGDVFLISLKAGGFGLNLTAADYVIHMDPWWNPAAEDQASDRAHRIGQTRPVTIYRFITRGTIEEKIVELHHRKRELADSLLSDAADAEARLSPDELLALIRG